MRLLLLLAACQPEESPLMNPGDDCMSCHSAGRRIWTVAGTVFGTLDSIEGIEGAEVQVTDADGRELTLSSNSAGNFYTAEPLRPPLSVAVQFANRRMLMQSPAAGSCNVCHRPNGAAPGRLFAP